MSQYNHNDFSSSYSRSFEPQGAFPKTVRELDLITLRRNSAYPAFRTFCTLVWWVSLVICGLVGLVGVSKIVDDGPFGFLPGFTLIIVALVGVFLSKVTTEASLMLADIADCSIEGWRRAGRPSASQDAKSSQPQGRSDGAVASDLESEEASDALDASGH